MLDIENMRIANLIKNQIELEKFKKLFEEPIWDNELNPSKITYKLIGHYALITSTIAEVRKILYKYTTKMIIYFGKSYFIMHLPEKKETLRELKSLLAVSGCQLQYELTIDGKSLRAIYTKKKELPRFWADRLPLLKADLKSIEYLTYTPTDKPFFSLIPLDSAKDFVKDYDFQTPYAFYSYAVWLHVGSSTGLFNQSSINTVVANKKDIRKLLPSKVTFDILLKNNPCIKKVNQNLIFYYDIENIQKSYFHYNLDVGRYTRSQAIFVPFKLLPEVFKSCSFGINGLRYFLFIIYGLKMYQNPKVVYTPSYLIENAHLNTKKGKNHTAEVIERPLKYLKDIKVIKSYGVIDLKANKGIPIFLRDLHKWQPPPPKPKQKKET